jgi:hypothetical protein
MLYDMIQRDDVEVAVEPATQSIYLRANDLDALSHSNGCGFTIRLNAEAFPTRLSSQLEKSTVSAPDVEKLALKSHNAI